MPQLGQPLVHSVWHPWVPSTFLGEASGFQQIDLKCGAEQLQLGPRAAPEGGRLRTVPGRAGDHTGLTMMICVCISASLPARPWLLQQCVKGS